LRAFALIWFVSGASFLWADTRASPPAPAAALSKESVTREGRKAWRQVLGWPDSCEEGYDYPDPALGGVAFHALGNDRYLVEVVCTLGAYQGYQRYYLLDESAPQPMARALSFVAYEASGKQGQPLTRVQTEEVWGSPQFDAKSKRLSVMRKFRGSGDCGTLAVYGFDAGDPQLMTLRAKTACDGRGAGIPERWPRVNVSRQR
jgi:Protein of unknown function (DUF1176)